MLDLRFGFDPFLPPGFWLNFCRASVLNPLMFDLFACLGLTPWPDNM